MNLFGKVYYLHKTCGVGCACSCSFAVARLSTWLPMVLVLHQQEPPIGQWLCRSPLGGQTFALYQWISVWLVSCHYWVMNLYYFAPCLVGTWYLKGSASNYFYEGTEMGIHTFSMTARDDWYEFYLSSLCQWTTPLPCTHTCPRWWSECSLGNFFISGLSRQ